MQNYQHPNIPEFKATIDKDWSYSVFLRGKKALEEVSKEDLKHMWFHIEEDRSHNIVMPIGTAWEDIKTWQCVQVCDRWIVMKYRHWSPVEQEEKRDRIDDMIDHFHWRPKGIYTKSEIGLFLRLAMEKFAPKEKALNKEFDKFIYKNHKVLSSESIERFVQFLKDNGVREK